MDRAKPPRQSGLFATLKSVLPEALPPFLRRFEALDQAFAKLTRDQALPTSVLARKAVTYVESMALSALYLRGASRLGKRARARGRPFIENQGRLLIGDDFQLVSLFVRSHLVTGHRGILEIGDAVNINFGAAISARQSVKIGNRVRIGPYCVIMDSDYHSAREGEETMVQPVVIEDDVWLAGRVSVLRGAHIGHGSVITAGSVVTGEIPPRVVAGGVPARVLRRREEGDPATFSWQGQSESSASRRNAPPAYSRAMTPVPPSARIPVTPPMPAFGAQSWPAGPPSQVVPSISDGPYSSARPRSLSSGPRGGNGSAASAVELGSVTDAVEAVFRELFGLEGPLDPSWSSNDIAKWDSLGQLRLLHLLEERFSVSIPESELVNMSSVGRVCSIVQECVEQLP
jgi:acetyltransferase-like isoleucine patch superfamily enzyme/acyl carrier protein